MSDHALEIEQGQRFPFGRNWSRFLSVLDEQRIEEAVSSLRRRLEVESLDGRSFIDVGSGSGLFSLAARRLGARVLSFDFDPASVACTRELRRRYFPNDANWDVQEGSILDTPYVNGLGTFDVVYSWGVLHHTGRMWEALEHVQRLVEPGGKLFIAIYNDQGLASRSWLGIKRAYVRSPAPLRTGLVLAVGAYFYARHTLGKALGVRSATRKSADVARRRGMARWYDLVDWVGGYPFEVAKPEEILHFYREKGFVLDQLFTCAGRHGCNEYVFSRALPSPRVRVAISGESAVQTRA